jgi:hypothetical protein
MPVKCHGRHFHKKAWKAAIVSGCVCIQHNNKMLWKARKEQRKIADTLQIFKGADAYFCVT